jgi:hypothetical protein
MLGILKLTNMFSVNRKDNDRKCIYKTSNYTFMHNYKVAIVNISFETMI